MRIRFFYSALTGLLAAIAGTAMLVEHFMWSWRVVSWNLAGWQRWSEALGVMFDPAFLLWTTLATILIVGGLGFVIFSLVIGIVRR